MIRKSLLLVMIMVMVGSLSFVNAQEKKKLIGDYLSVSGWMNIQYDYEQQLNNEGVSITDINTFNVRRARLDFKGNISKNLEFRVQADMAGSPKLVDGFVKVKLSKYFNIQAGQFKIPFTFENPQSPLTLEGVEYAQVISKLSGYSDVTGVTTYSGGRDVGLMIYGNLFSFEDNGKQIPILTYKLGVFNLKLCHELNQLFHTLDGHGVVDAGPHTAHSPVTLQVHEAGIRSGLDEGGIDLFTDDGGVYYESGYSDTKSWYEVGEVTIPVSDDFTGTDTADLDQGEVVFSVDSFLNDEITYFDFTPHNTTIRVEGGKVVDMNRRNVP